MRILHLYRPRLPSLRAQAIQVVHACHALAERGHTVTLLADRGEGPDLRPEAALAALGLSPHPNLRLQICPVAHSGLAGLWFRAQLWRWWQGAPGWVLARDKRRLQAALRRLGRRQHRILLETHELDSALATERGADPTPVAALEAGLLPECSALVANCGGTLAAWEEAHGALLPRHRRAVHNAISPTRRRALHPAPDAVIRCVGSLRDYKGVPELAEAARGLPLPLELVGGSPDELAALPAHAGLRSHPPVPYTEVPDLLARSAVLLLPLRDNLFGRRLTSPLKLWDYLATAAPIVAPALPSVQEIRDLTGAVMHLHRPGDADDLARACREALQAPERTPTVRSWDTRAAELEAVMQLAEQDAAPTP